MGEMSAVILDESSLSFSRPSAVIVESPPEKQHRYRVSLSGWCRRLYRGSSCQAHYPGGQSRAPGVHPHNGPWHRWGLRRDLPRAGSRLVWPGPKCRLHWSHHGCGTHTSSLGVYSEGQGGVIAGRRPNATFPLSALSPPTWRTRVARPTGPNGTLRCQPRRQQRQK
jgi:hypothetical protein